MPGVAISDSLLQAHAVYRDMLTAPSPIFYSDNAVVPFLLQLLSYDPNVRLSADEALKHPYFMPYQDPAVRRVVSTPPTALLHAILIMDFINVGADV